MTHKVIRYQDFSHVPGKDLCCSCGARWYVRSDRRTYGHFLALVAKHFGWEPPRIGASEAGLTYWLHQNLPENLRPKT